MKKLPYIATGLLLVLGLAILFYPSISSWLNSLVQSEAVVSYDESIGQMSDAAKEASLEEARQYNSSLTGQGITDPFIPGGGLHLPTNYTSVLDAGDGMMGTLHVPAIDVELPIYHGTSPKVIEQGVGHMEMTAFPIGGKGNHSVLTSHSGLPSTVLFTDLEKLSLGDRFYIKVSGSIAAYEIDSIQVVEPTNTKPLIPQKDGDYTTLVTCTPYAINSHRLLVRGAHIPYDGAIDAATPSLNEWFKIPYDVVIACMALAAVLLTIAILQAKRRRREKRRSAMRPMPKHPYSRTSSSFPASAKR